MTFSIYSSQTAPGMPTYTPAEQRARIQQHFAAKALLEKQRLEPQRKFLRRRATLAKEKRVALLRRHCLAVRTPWSPPIDVTCNLEIHTTYLQHYENMVHAESQQKLELRPESGMLEMPQWYGVPRGVNGAVIPLYRGMRTAPARSKTQSSKFFDLPGEVRVMIFTEVFKNLRPLAPVPHRRWMGCRVGDGQVPTLFMVCKMWYLESQEAFYRNGTLLLRLEEDWVSTALATLDDTPWCLDASAASDRSNATKPQAYLGPLIARFRTFKVIGCIHSKSILALDRLVWLLKRLYDKWANWRHTITFEAVERAEWVNEHFEGEAETALDDLGMVLRYHLLAGNITPDISFRETRHPYHQAFMQEQYKHALLPHTEMLMVLHCGWTGRSKCRIIRSFGIERDQQLHPNFERTPTLHMGQSCRFATDREAMKSTKRYEGYLPGAVRR